MIIFDKCVNAATGKDSRLKAIRDVIPIPNNLNAAFTLVNAAIYWKE